MTKAEIIKALENMNDNEEVAFIEYDTDRDGWLVERAVSIVKLESAKERKARKMAKK